MHMDFSVFNRHPWLKWVVGVIALIVFISLWRGGSSTVSTSSSGNGQPSDAVQIATIQANAQANTANDALQAQHDNNQMQLAVAQLASGLQTTQSNNQLAASLSQIQASLDLGTHQLDTQQAIAGMQAATQQQANTLSFKLQNQELRNQYDQNAWNYALAYHAQDVQYAQNAWNYQLDYAAQQNAQTTNQALIGLLANQQKAA